MPLRGHARARSPGRRYIGPLRALAVKVGACSRERFAAPHDRSTNRARPRLSGLGRASAGIAPGSLDRSGHHGPALCHGQPSIDQRPPARLVPRWVDLAPDRPRLRRRPPQAQGRWGPDGHDQQRRSRPGHRRPEASRLLWHPDHHLGPPVSGARWGTSPPDRVRPGWTATRLADSGWRRSGLGGRRWTRHRWTLPDSQA